MSTIQFSHKKSLLIGFTVLLFNIPTQAQEIRYGSVTGFIHDQESGVPINHVNVFLDNTTRGDVTDQTGKYIIPKIPPDKYVLMVAMMGYELRKMEITVSVGKTATHHFKLKPKIFEFQALEITANKPAQWEKDFQEFKRLFVGTSAFARECEIINPEIVSFSKGTQGVFGARAQKPIVLINKALGYKIEFTLEYFSATRVELNYSNGTRFTELEPRDEKEKLIWQANRLNAYTGSMRHFLAELLSETGTESFTILAFSQCPSWQNGEKREKKPSFPVFETTIQIEPGSQPSEMTLSFRGCLQVEFSKEPAEEGYLHSIFSQDIANMRGYPQISWIELPNPSVSVDSRGNLLYRNVIKTHGYWAWKRVGDLLPTDYIPEVSKSFNTVSTPAIDSLEKLLQAQSLQEISGSLINDVLDELCFEDNDHKKIIDQLYKDIFDIAVKTEKQKWKQMKTNKEKADYLRRFWLIRDLSYGSKANERLNEHYDRLRFARSFYNASSAFKSTGYDDRGKIYIKYGAPDDKVAEGISSASKPTETWLYEIGKQITFEFLDRGGYGYGLSYRIGEGVVMVRPKVKLLAIGEFLRQRNGLTLRYSNLYSKFLRLQDDMGGEDSIGPESALRDLERSLTEFDQERFVDNENFPLGISRIFKGFSELDFVVQTAVFGNNSNAHELALAYGFKKDQLKQSKKGNRSDILVRTVIRNPELVNIVSQEDQITIEPQDFDENEEFTTTLQMTNDANAYYVLIEADNPAGKQRGIKDFSIKVPHFRDGQFRLSSVIFAKNVMPMRGSSSDKDQQSTSAIIRNNLAIDMYPFSTLNRAKAVFVYFEIYHLEKGPDGKTHYRIEYSVHPRKKKGVLALVSRLNPFKRNRGSISITDLREGVDTEEVFWIQLDFSQLEQDQYDLIVKVTDVNTGKTKESKIEFKLK